MNFKDQIDDITEVLIIFIIFSLSINKFSLYVNILILSYIFLLCITGILTQRVFSISNKLNILIKTKIIQSAIINIVLSIYMILLIYGLFYFYQNFTTGYFYAILLILSLFGILLILKTNGFLVNRNLIPTQIIVSLYGTFFIFIFIFHHYFVKINSLNLFYLLIDLIIFLPLNFFSYFVNTLGTKNLIEFFLELLVEFFLIFVVLIISIGTLPNKIFTEDPYSGQQDFILNMKIAEFPFLSLILLAGFLKEVNGLTEFIRFSIWLLSVIFVLLMLFRSDKIKRSKIIFEKIRILLWICLLQSFAIIYNVFFIFSPLINFFDNFMTDLKTVYSLTFIVIATVVFFSMYYLLTKISIPEQIRIISFFTLIIVASLLSKIPNITIKLALFSIIIVIVFVFKESQNSISLNHRNLIKIITENIQNYRKIIHYTTEILIYYVLFLLL